MWIQKNDTNELTYKTETHRLREQMMVAWGKDGGKVLLGSLKTSCTHCYV